MPTYSYACTECDNRFDIVQAFTDSSLTECPQCSGRLRKLFSSVGIVFKGSGFYRTDSRAGASSDTGSSAKSETTSDASTKSDAAKTETKSEKKSESSTSNSSSSTTSTSKAAS